MNALSARHRVKRLDCITGSPMLSHIRGTDEERGAGTHRSPPIFARTESGATQRGRIRNRRGQKAASGLADRGRRGHGQDQDTRSSGGGSDLGRRRPGWVSDRLVAYPGKFAQNGQSGQIEPGFSQCARWASRNSAVVPSHFTETTARPCGPQPRHLTRIVRSSTLAPGSA